MPLCLLVVVFVTSTAHADTGKYDQKQQASLLAAFGDMVVAQRYGSGLGLHGELDSRAGPVHLVGELTFLRFSADQDDGLDIAGSLVRAGLSTRYLLAAWLSDETEIAGWLEAGIGWQRVPGRDVTSRADAMVGFVIEGRGAKMAIPMGVRILVARDPRRGSNAPNSNPRTRGPGFDLGMMLTLGVRHRL